MEAKPVMAPEARLFLLKDNCIIFKERSTFILEKTENRRAIIRIANIYLWLTPNTVLWFDSPQDDQQKCLTYYFMLNNNEEYMVKIHKNIQFVHDTIKTIGCDLKQRKKCFKQPDYNVTNSNLFYQAMETIGSVINYGGSTLGVGISKGAQYCAGGLQKLGGVIANNISPSENKLNLPIAKNISQKAKNLSEGAVNLAQQLVNKFFTDTRFHNYVIPKQQDHPLVKVGKNVLGGAFNLYTGVADGINHLQVGIANGAGQVLEKKYGQDVNVIVQNAVQAGNNCQGIIRQPIRQVGRNIKNSIQQQ